MALLFPGSNITLKARHGWNHTKNSYSDILTEYTLSINQNYGTVYGKGISFDTKFEPCHFYCRCNVYSTLCGFIWCSHRPTVTNFSQLATISQWLSTTVCRLFAGKPQFSRRKWLSKVIAAGSQLSWQRRGPWYAAIRLAMHHTVQT